jgi:hypothetical protein
MVSMDSSWIYGYLDDEQAGHTPLSAVSKSGG